MPILAMCVSPQYQVCATKIDGITPSVRMRSYWSRRANWQWTITGFNSRLRGFVDSCIARSTRSRYASDAASPLQWHSS